VLGLALAHGQLAACHVQRVKGELKVVHTAAAPLPLDLLHPEPELLGLEIRSRLDAAGIRERNCVVALPAPWLMSLHSPLPDLAPEDAESLLQLEAEKGFPCDPAQLQIARSPHRSPERGYVTQLAARREHVDHLVTLLRAAGLRPVSFTLGLGSLAGVLAAPGAGRITLRLEPKGATLLVSVGGGIAAFRTFDASIDSEAGETVINGPALARELRITLEQLPADLRAELRTIFLTGDPAMTRQLAEVLADWAADAGLTLETEPAAGAGIGGQVAEQLARRALETGASPLEFLPPRASRWSALVARYSSRRLATVGFAAAAAAVVLGLLFGWQEYRYRSLRTEWLGMQARVTALDAVQTRIRDYRPWYDAGFRSLTVLRRVTESFPESGAVTAKSVEIQAGGTVSISGTARDNAALLRTLDELRKVREVQSLKIEQIRGKVPAQFTFTFRWNPLAAP
jgi:hypothetical protein